MLDLVNLSLSYGPVPAVRDLCLSVGEAEAVALIGANGAGKSSVLKAVLGLERSRGGVSLGGVEINHLPTPDRVSAGLALSPEGRLVFPDMTVRENLSLGLIERTKPRAGSLEQEVCALFPRLEERMTQAAGSLSGGEQQMLAVGRALMSEPRVLLLDEPTLGLAPIIVSQIEAIIHALQQKGTSVLLAEQNAEMALSCTSRVYILDCGELVKEGVSQELVGDPVVREAYLGFGPNDDE